MTPLDAITTATAAGIFVALYALLRLRSANRLLGQRLAELDRQPAAQPAGMARAAWFTDDEMASDPAWYPLALSFGHAPELDSLQRAELAEMFEPFDRLMTRLFRDLDTLGVTP